MKNTSTTGSYYSHTQILKTKTQDTNVKYKIGSKQSAAYAKF